MNVRLNSKDQLMIFSDMSTMLAAGIPILEIVESMVDEAKGNQRKVLEAIKQSLYQGHQLSDALKTMPRAFDPVTVNLLSAAEQAGTLETTLQDITESTQKSIAFTDQVRSSFVYPAFICIVFIGVLGAMLGFVIPRIATIFQSMGSKLPPATEFLIASSQFVVANYVYILAGAAALGLALFAAYRSNKKAFINAFLRLPYFNKLGRQIDLARFARSMALLLKAGIPVSEALTLTEDVVNKKEISRVIQSLNHSVSEGKSLGEELRAHERLVTPTSIHMIETGERTGTLDKSMQDLANYFESRVSRSLKTIVTLLEPTLLLVIGGLVGGMMIAIVAPMYTIITSIGS